MIERLKVRAIGAVQNMIDRKMAKMIHELRQHVQWLEREREDLQWDVRHANEEYRYAHNAYIEEEKRSKELEYVIGVFEGRILGLRERVQRLGQERDDAIRNHNESIVNERYEILRKERDALREHVQRLGQERDDAIRNHNESIIAWERVLEDREADHAFVNERYEILRKERDALRASLTKIERTIRGSR